MNGKNRSVLSDSDTPLIYVLRNELGLTGTKLGCGLEQCGACMVLVDGEAAYSCTRAVKEFEGCWIETVEGFGSPEQPSLVQKLFADENAAQCGYCTPGMVMASVSLVNENPKLTEAQVREGLEGNLCRCTGYHNIVKAVLQVSES